MHLHFLKSSDVKLVAGPWTVTIEGDTDDSPDWGTDARDEAPGTNATALLTAGDGLTVPSTQRSCLEYPVHRRPRALQAEHHGRCWSHLFLRRRQLEHPPRDRIMMALANCGMRLVARSGVGWLENDCGIKLDAETIA